MAGRLLHRFRGGLRLAPEKDRQTAEPIATMPPPRRVVIPMRQHIGTPARPLVAAGDDVLRGQPIGQATSAVSASVHASISGRVIDVGPYPVPHASGLDDLCVVIESNGEDRAVPPRPRGHDYHLDEPGVLRQQVADAGIAGLGGAVFPTATKLAAEAERRLRTLVLNGAECEPYISCDDMLMRERADEVVAGALVMLHILQINECVIAIEQDKPQAHAAIDAAIAAAGDQRVTLTSVPAIYPEGSERQLIQVLSGLEVPHDGLPIDIGYLCHNVATAAAVARAVIDGEPLLSRVVSVCGPGVRTPRNVEVRLGTPVAEVIAFCGGYHDGADQLLMGGIMTGVPLASDSVPIVKAFNCALVLTSETPARRNAPLPCIRCGECAEVCPAALLPQQLYWYSRARDLDNAVRFNLVDCIECGCCDLVCPSHIPLSEEFRHAKSSLLRQEEARGRNALAKLRFERRNQRLDEQQARREQRSRERRQALGAATRQPPAAAPAGGDAAAPTRDLIEAAVERARARRAARDAATPGGSGSGSGSGRWQWRRQRATATATARNDAFPAAPVAAVAPTDQRRPRHAPGAAGAGTRLPRPLSRVRARRAGHYRRRRPRRPGRRVRHAAATSSRPGTGAGRQQHAGHGRAAGAGVTAAVSLVDCGHRRGVRRGVRQAAVRRAGLQSVQSGHGRLCRRAGVVPRSHDPLARADGRRAGLAGSRAHRARRRAATRAGVGRNNRGNATGRAAHADRGRAHAQRGHAGRQHERPLDVADLPGGDCAGRNHAAGTENHSLAHPGRDAGRGRAHCRGTAPGRFGSLRLRRLPPDQRRRHARRVFRRDRSGLGRHFAARAADLCGPDRRADGTHSQLWQLSRRRRVRGSVSQHGGAADRPLHRAARLRPWRQGRAAMTAARTPGRSLRIGLALLALGGVTAALLAALHEVTAPQIDANQRAFALRQLGELVAADAYDNALLSDVVVARDEPLLGGGEREIFRAFRGDQPVAAVFSVETARGYSGPIGLLVGVHADGRIAGVRVRYHRETPGLGDRIELRRTDWLLDFDGRTLGDPPRDLWQVQRDGGAFDQFTGATVTPRAVVLAVRDALLYFDAHRAELFAPPPVRTSP